MEQSTSPSLQIVPSVRPGFLDYLRLNGYKDVFDSPVPTPAYYLVKYPKSIVLMHDKVDFMIYDDGEPGQRAGCFSRYASHTGISQMSLAGWMALLDITDAVPVLDFISKYFPTAKNQASIINLFAMADHSAIA